MPATKLATHPLWVPIQQAFEFPIGFPFEFKFKKRHIATTIFRNIFSVFFESIFDWKLKWKSNWKLKCLLNRRPAWMTTDGVSLEAAAARKGPSYRYSRLMYMDIIFHILKNKPSSILEYTRAHISHCNNFSTSIAKQANLDARALITTNESNVTDIENLGSIHHIY